MPIRYKLLLMLLLLILLSGCGDEIEQLHNGDPAPLFALEKLEGGTAQFPADYQGQKVIAIRFWADWCPFCSSEMRLLEPVYQKYRDKGLTILALNVRQDRATAEFFINELNISYNTLLDIEGDVARSYGVTGLPTTLFVDGNGILQRRIIGESTPEVFEQIILEIMQQSREQP